MYFRTIRNDILRNKAITLDNHDICRRCGHAGFAGGDTCRKSYGRDRHADDAGENTAFHADAFGRNRSCTTGGFCGTA